MNQFIIHQGGKHATLEELAAVPLPQSTRTYGVIPHADYRNLLLDRMPEYGLKLESERIALSNHGERLFGLLLLQGDRPDYQVALGYRNSYDKSMVAGLVIGSRVFVCDNLAFSGERQMRIRHTIHAQYRLERGVPNLLGSIQSVIDWQDRFIAQLKQQELQPIDRHEVAYELLRRRLLPPTRVAHAIREVESSAGTTAWDYFNAFTSSMRDLSADRLVAESKRLTSAFARAYGHDRLCQPNMA